MQVIENAAILEVIGGAAKREIKCEISTDKTGCEGSLEQFFEVAFQAFDEMQRWGGNVGRWLYDTTHRD